MTLRDRVAIAGIGETDYSRESGRTELQLTLQAITAALEDAGIERHEVDGLMRWSVDTSPEVEVLSHRVWNQRVELQVRTSDACFARLAYAYYPYLRVVVDGKIAQTLETADRFIALRLDRGEHLIVLEPFLSPMRRALLALDIVLLAAAGLVLIRRRRT